MSLGSAASLCEEHFPFSHTIRVESQTNQKNSSYGTTNKLLTPSRGPQWRSTQPNVSPPSVPGKRGLGELSINLLCLLSLKKDIEQQFNNYPL